MRLGFATFGDYFAMVEENPGSPEEQRFIDLITTHYTYFMRESSQFDFIRATAFAELSQRPSNRPWRILCAGCATGEECYDLAMLAEDFSRLHNIPDVFITGIDLSEPALRRARAGVYPASCMTKVPDKWRTMYFENKGNDFKVSDRLRARIRFAQGNLSDPDMLHRTYDLVLCRNTTIYLNRDAKQRVINTLHRHLAHGGYLVLGHAEIISNRSQFEYCGNSIYRKQPKASAL